MTLFPILLVFLGVLFVLLAFAATKMNPRMFHGRPINRKRPREEVLREANRKLAHDPRNQSALGAVAGIYFESGEWDKAYKTYEILSDMPLGPESGTSLFEANYRCGFAAAKLNLYDTAYKYYIAARSTKNNDFNVNFQLGDLEFRRRNYDKSIQFYQQAVTLNNADMAALRGLGMACFKASRYADAINCLRKALAANAADREAFFTMAVCYDEAGQKEEALRIYSRLRPDPAWGPEACLRSGQINLSLHQNAKAIEDFDIGLHHQEIPREIEVELHYQLGLTCLEEKEIEKALEHLKKACEIEPDYKGAAALITKYEQLNANKNLQIYTLGTPAEFMALCRKIVINFFPKARVRFTRTNMSGNDWADLIAEVDTPKWSDVVMFRFIRTQGNIGEFVVRDFHAHLKDSKSGKGICMGTGKYSDEARRFTDARLIDLVEKSRLETILAGLDSSAPATPASASTVPAEAPDT